MKKRWLITGALSAGLILSAAPAAMADMWVQGIGNDAAAGSGVVAGSSTGRNTIGETAGAAGAKTAEPAEIIVEPKPETGTQIAESDIPAAGAANGEAWTDGISDGNRALEIVAEVPEKETVKKETSEKAAEAEDRTDEL